eukprot:15799001-Heterocapsa_arctica.AAC.1
MEPGPARPRCVLTRKTVRGRVSYGRVPEHAEGGPRAETVKVAGPRPKKPILYTAPAVRPRAQAQ